MNEWASKQINEQRKKIQLNDFVAQTYIKDFFMSTNGVQLNMHDRNHELRKM